MNRKRFLALSMLGLGMIPFLGFKKIPFTLPRKETIDIVVGFHLQPLPIGGGKLSTVFEWMDAKSIFHKLQWDDAEQCFYVNGRKAIKVNYVYSLENKGKLGLLEVEYE